MSVVHYRFFHQKCMIIHSVKIFSLIELDLDKISLLWYYCKVLNLYAHHVRAKSFSAQLS